MPLARAARAADLETVITPFKINTSFNVGEHLNVAVSGAFKLKVKLVYDKEKFGADYFETELTQTLSTAITGTVTGTVGTSTLTEPATLLDVNVPIGTTPLSADVAVTFPVKADISAEGSFQARLEAGAGYRYTSVDGAQKSNSIANNDISAKIAGNFEIGAGPRLDVGVSLPGDLLSAKVSGDAMLSLHGDTDKSASALLESKHTCDCCVDGAIDLSAKIRGSLNYELCEWAKGSLAGITLFDTTMVICTFYYSAKNSEDSIFRGQPHFEANADCPNTSYPITILTRQVDGTPVTTQIEITYGNENKPKATISSGQTAWLCGGVNYRLKATIDGGPVIKTVMISGKETITLDGQGISLSGIVTEKGSNAPVANAEVTLTRGTKTLTDTTATDGRYLLNKISAGSYTLAIKKDGYRPYTAEINLTADTQHNAALEISGRRVTGSVSDENGSALSGVLVTISRDGLSKQCTTDENGAYQSDPLEAGDYTIQFTKFGYQPVTKSITVARTDMVCDATMQKASAALTVTVTDLDGKPISGAEIALYPDADPTVPAIQGTTDDAGTAAWSDLSAGTYTITAAKDGFAPYSGEVAVAADQENQ